MKGYQTKTIEAAMRALKLIEAQSRILTMGEYAELVRSDIGCSRATGYRYARAAVDILGIQVDMPEGMAKGWGWAA
jgi:hypothetical protein